MNDRLAVIEAREPTSYSASALIRVLLTEEERDALVGVAKAARVRQECGHDDTCSIRYWDFADLAKGVEPLAPCDCGYAELAAALSALDGEEGEA